MSYPLTQYSLCNRYTIIYVYLYIFICIVVYHLCQTLVLRLQNKSLREWKDRFPFLFLTGDPSSTIVIEGISSRSSPECYQCVTTCVYLLVASVCVAISRSPAGEESQSEFSVFSSAPGCRRLL